MQKDHLQEIRGAVYERNGARLIAALAGQKWACALQLVGDGLLAAMAQDVDGATDLASACFELLRDRLWRGDEELADQLAAALGKGPTPLLRPLPVDLEELSGILEGDPTQGGGHVDLETGEVLPSYWDEDDEEDDDAEERRLLSVECLGSRSGYGDMEHFIETVTSERFANRLWCAISGRGAFRRFKDALADEPDELERWYVFSNERQRGRARAWLADEGYTPRRVRQGS